MSEIYFEYVRQGNVVKVTAIESETKTEAAVVVPANLNENEMQARALQKLLYVMKKKAES